MSEVRSTLDVAALYVDPRGPYPKLLGPEKCWDEARDARTYAGPWPVVAHPPCGPWGRLSRFCTKQPVWAGPHAVEMVRRFGGVLEHPAQSKLWEVCGLPLPGELPDAYGGRTVAVQQVDWGHVARKPTWLYVVGAGVRVHHWPGPGTPTHWVSGARDRAVAKLRGVCPPGIKMCSSEQRRRTPLGFARFLIELAAQCRPRAKAAP